MFVDSGRTAMCVVGVLTSLALVGGPPHASAQTGCPVGFVLMTVPDVLSTLAAPGSETAVRAADLNGNGYLCVQAAPGGGLARFTDDQP